MRLESESWERIPFVTRIALGWMAVGTAVAVQQKMMRHSDIRTTMNIYGDVVTYEMEQAHGKVVGLTLSQA
jgi:integrase